MFTPEFYLTCSTLLSSWLSPGILPYYYLLLVISLKWEYLTDQSLGHLEEGLGLDRLKVIRYQHSSRTDIAKVIDTECPLLWNILTSWANRKNINSVVIPNGFYLIRYPHLGPRVWNSERHLANNLFRFLGYIITLWQ